MRRLTRFIAFALLAWLPLQAAALPGLITVCELDPAHSPMHRAMHDDGLAADHAHGDHEHGDDGASGHDGHSGGSPGGHGCCHVYTTAAAAPVLHAPDAVAAALATASPHLAEFIPEQPHRPPLARL
jgi:hypothetical protein